MATLVYLAWLNDQLLDVYAEWDDAESRIEVEKRRYPDERFRQLPSGRWHSQRIARLEVEERKVK
jgi:hypothetical protein